ncbi:hypothetical protein BSL78_23099 [Apostichopus japonicus]|uniref:Uncharacterized protein n=1 Tax=Stichopus japonicus TaxID=307972 RepID=A0A2G8JWK4_STIJA|nr:hypothetical protein BSL78_23099 [Apostichopus japonicus]
MTTILGPLYREIHWSSTKFLAIPENAVTFFPAMLQNRRRTSSHNRVKHKSNFSPTKYYQRAHALDCYLSTETDCSPNGDTCDEFDALLPTVKRTTVTCPTGSQCSKSTIALSNSDVSVTTDEAACITLIQPIENKCYGRDMLDEIMPNFEATLTLVADSLGLTIDDAEICLCDGNVCNHSVKFSVNLALVVFALFVSSATYLNYM